MTDDTPRRLEYMPLADLLERRHPGNVKAHADDVIDASLARFGYVEPIVLDERTGRLVSGHGRVEQLTARHSGADGGLIADPPEGLVVMTDGTWLVPVVRGWASVDDAEAEAAMITLNRSGEIGGWKLPELAAQLTELAQSPAGLPPGYTAQDYDAILADLAPPDFSPTDGTEQPRLDRKFHLVCNNCGAAVDPAASQRVEQ